jgi:hypothetical protein
MYTFIWIRYELYYIYIHIYDESITIPLRIKNWDSRVQLVHFYLSCRQKLRNEVIRNDEKRNVSLSLRIILTDIAPLLQWLMLSLEFCHKESWTKSSEIASFSSQNIPHLYLYCSYQHSPVYKWSTAWKKSTRSFLFQNPMESISHTFIIPS